MFSPLFCPQTPFFPLKLPFSPHFLPPTPRFVPPTPLFSANPPFYPLFPPNPVFPLFCPKPPFSPFFAPFSSFFPLSPRFPLSFAPNPPFFCPKTPFFCPNPLFFSQHLQGANLIWCCHIPLGLHKPSATRTWPLSCRCLVQPCLRVSDGDLSLPADIHDEIFLPEQSLCCLYNHCPAWSHCRGDKCPQLYLFLLRRREINETEVPEWGLCVHLEPWGSFECLNIKSKALGEGPKEATKVVKGLEGLRALSLSSWSRGHWGQSSLGLQLLLELGQEGFEVGF